MLDPASLVGAGGRLVLDEPGIVVTGGARVRRRRRIIVKLEQGAVAAVREAIVLGKAGEHSSVVDPQLVATLGVSPLLRTRCASTPARLELDEWTTEDDQKRSRLYVIANSVEFLAGRRSEQPDPDEAEAAATA